MAHHSTLDNTLRARIRATPNIVRVQLVGTLLNSASVVVKLFMPLLFRLEYGLDVQRIGLLMASYGAGCIYGAYAGGVLTQKLDPRAMTAFCLCFSGGFAAFLATPLNLFSLFLLVPAIGALDGAFRPANLRLVLETVAPSQAPWFQGVHRVCFNFGVALAGFIAAQLATHGYSSIFLVMGIVTMLGGILIGAYAQGPCPVKSARTPRRQRTTVRPTAYSPWHDRSFLLFICAQLLALAIFDQMYGTFGLFLTSDYQLSNGWMGYLFALNALAIVCFQLPALKLIDRLGLARTGQCGAILLAIAFPLLLLGNSSIYAIFTMACLTAAEILLTPAWTLAVMDRSAHRDRGRYLGMFSAAWLGHSLYGPAVGMWIYAAWGGQTLWWTCCALGVAVWALQARTIGRWTVRLDKSSRARTTLRSPSTNNDI